MSLLVLPSGIAWSIADNEARYWVSLRLSDWLSSSSFWWPEYAAVQEHHETQRSEHSKHSNRHADELIVDKLADEIGRWHPREQQQSNCNIPPA